MKKILTILLVGFVSLLSVIVVSSVFFGTERSMDSIRFLSSRLGFINQPQRNIDTLSYTRDDSEGSVLGEFDKKIDHLKQDVYQAIEFQKKPSPFVVPTEGIAAHKNFLYDPVLHGGIDIWTNQEGKGVSRGSSKGYPVYSACSGVVIRVYQPNEEIEVECNRIDESFSEDVPSLHVKVLYAHMGDAVTKERYHKLSVGQRLTKGQLIGWQGNVSSIVPVNRVTHLHFGVYDLTRSGRPTVDPEYYIGVPTTIVGQIFKTEIE